jgi:hypothetical protein
MATTYEPISTTTLGSAASGVTFSSIASTYTDLVVVVTGYNTTSASDSPILRLNGDTATNYSETSLSGNGTSATSNRLTSSTYINTLRVGGFSNTSTQPGMILINVNNYSNSTTYKTALVRAGIASATYPSTEAITGLWRNTAAITSLSVTFASSLFAIGSTFTLHGIKAA